MENKLYEILSNLELDQEYNVILQGSLDDEEEFPNNFFTYWNWDNARDGFYDNKHTRNLMGYQIDAYSTDRQFLNEMMEKAIEALETNGFIIDDDAVDVSCQKGYTAKMIDVYFIKKKEE